MSFTYSKTFKEMNFNIKALLF